MTDQDAASEYCVTVGGLSRHSLLAALNSRGILLNVHAETLLANVEFDDKIEARVIAIKELTVGDLGFTGGASLPQIFAAAGDRSLKLCPPDTGPYLRLARLQQASSSESAMSTGRSPSNALTVASPIVRRIDDFPKGFYLRVVDGQPWLRGYRCDDAHVWASNDLFAFRV